MDRFCHCLVFHLELSVSANFLQCAKEINGAVNERKICGQTHFIPCDFLRQIEIAYGYIRSGHSQTKWNLLASVHCLIFVQIFDIHRVKHMFWPSELQNFRLNMLNGSRHGMEKWSTMLPPHLISFRLFSFERNVIESAVYEVAAR